jgi:hypothetical protein
LKMQHDPCPPPQSYAYDFEAWPTKDYLKYFDNKGITAHVTEARQQNPTTVTASAGRYTWLDGAAAG